MSRLLGVAIALVFVLVSFGTWVIYRAVERAQDSNRWVAHTQEVMAAIEGALSEVVDADNAVRRFRSSGDATALAPLERAERAIAADVDQLQALTQDNPSQQTLVARFRDEAMRTLASLRAQVDAVRGGRPTSPADAAAQQEGLETARATMRRMRSEESRLLAERVRLDHNAVGALQSLAIALVAIVAALLGFVVWLVANLAARQRQNTETLQRANDDLEAQVNVRAAELRDSNARLQSIIDSAVDAIIVIDTKGLIEAFNRGAEKLFGYTESEVCGRNVSILMPSPDHENHDAYLARYLTTGAATIIGIGRQVTGRRRDGTTVPLHLSVGEMWIKGERKFTGMLHDLSERMRLDAELRASEARWRSIVDSAVDGIVVIDAHGRVESFNPAAERLFGYEEREVVGKNVNILMPSPYHEEHDTYLAQYLATGVPKIIGTGREVTGRRKDGRAFPVHLSVGKLVVNGAMKFTGILHDLSARVQIEAQLREQASLARIGEMAAVIAHEVKNPLAGVRGAIQVIGTRLPKDSKDALMVKEIVSRIDALNDLMKDLLLFARPPIPKAAAVDLATLVATTAELLRGDPALKDVRVRIEGAVPPIMADPDLLKIVFVNLLVNSAHAMHGRGTIRVSLDAVADMSQIMFADEGPGIPSEVLDKIFVPFFTTKARGSGLGLPTAKRLVEAHHGHISIACPTGGGTVVTVKLPGAGAIAVS
jgi:PAS domain S-box-containing protein